MGIIPQITLGVFLKQILPCIAVPNLGGMIIAFTTMKEVETWYETLNKPWWTPPPVTFPIVWTFVYTSMGLASWLIFRSEGATRLLALILYCIQLILNFMWSPLFFNGHLITGALVDISLLWIVVALCIFAFLPLNKLASALMVPYLIWLSIATSLNFWIWKYN
ncbi:hypothetical protein RvY_06375 [Ramazzottius varieornatus]|uniref:Uncharacterized protein n=1 Tax=Ramazzottius varieornatus TaxID=947166 RepID=A0A1D1UYX1_RAMVA|nr:hypothetical protein RvY_06375 [Ramazzottius varieornatus]